MVNPIVQTVIGVVLVALVLIIGVIVFGEFESNVNHADLTSDASSAVNETAEQTYNGFELGALLPYILFAVAILVVLIGALAFRQ